MKERVVHGGSIYGEFFFNFVFAATATTIISGALAERVEFGAYLIYGVLATGFIQPVKKFDHIFEPIYHSENYKKDSRGLAPL